MSTHAITRLRRPAIFLAAAAAICACSVLVAGMLPRLQNAGVVAVGVTCDLVLVVPALYYLLLVRGRRWPAFSLVPVVIVLSFIFGIGCGAKWHCSNGSEVLLLSGDGYGTMCLSGSRSAKLAKVANSSGDGVVS